MTNILFCLLATVSDDSRYELHNETVNKYYDVVKELCRRKAEDSVLAEEAESRVWYFLLDNLKKLENRTDEEAYVYIDQTVVSAVAYCREENKRHDLSSVASVPLSREILGFERYKSERNPEEELINLEVKEVFLGYLRTVDKADLSILYLRFFEGHTIAEIAKAVKLPRSTVAHRIKRHLIELRKLYTGGRTNE